jgi:hypothetical protein
MIPAILKPHSEHPDEIVANDADHMVDEISDGGKLTYVSNIFIKKDNSNDYDSDVVRSVFGSNLGKLNEFLLNYNSGPEYDIVNTTKLINGVYRHIDPQYGVMHLIYLLKTNDIYIGIKLRAILKIFCRTITDGCNVGLGEVEAVSQYDDKPVFSVDFCPDESYKNMTSGEELMLLYRVLGVHETIRYFATLLSVF